MAMLKIKLIDAGGAALVGHAVKVSGAPHEKLMATACPSF